MSETSQSGAMSEVETTVVRVGRRGTTAVASMQRGLLEQANLKGQKLTGAALRFEDGDGLVILGGSKFTVRKIGLNRAEITSGGAPEVEVDEIEAAFARMKVAQFANGDAVLAPPLDAGQWRRTMDDRLAEARRVAGGAVDAAAG